MEGRVVMGQHMQRPWGRNGLVGLKTSKEVSKAAAEGRLLGREQVMQNLVGCGIKFGVYAKYTGMPLRAFKQRKGMISIEQRHVLTDEWRMLDGGRNKKFNR